MDRTSAREEAERLLGAAYVAAEPERPAEANRLARLAAGAAEAGAPLQDHHEGPWKVRKGTLARGEFELTVPAEQAAAVAALLNWADVAEPGAQS